MSRPLRQAWDRISIYLPVILMALMALGSWWLVRSTPTFTPAPSAEQVRHEADYFMRNFSIRSFDARGRRKNELSGEYAQHFPDTDTVEITNVRLQAYSELGGVTTATAERGISNADGSEVQLFGNAHVTRAPTAGQAPRPVPLSEFRSEFLHVYTNAERMKTHKPVLLVRGSDRFMADAMEYDNVSQTVSLRGHVRGEIKGRP